MAMDSTFWYEPTEEQRTGYAAWVEERPTLVRDVARRFQPWRLYRMASTGSRVVVLAFGEAEDPTEAGPVTLRVGIFGRFNEFLTFERQVFGIKPDDLTPCEVPSFPGFVMLTTDEEIEAARPAILESMRRAQEPAP